MVSQNTYRYGRRRPTTLRPVKAKLEDLWMVGISHLHPDHVPDLPAFLWLSHEVRKEPLMIFGPSGNDAAPEFLTFIARLFDEKTGHFRCSAPRWVGRMAVGVFGPISEELSPEAFVSMSV